MRARAKAVNSITEGIIWKNMLAFFFPILLGTFFQQLYNTADAIIVGNFVGKEALAAVGGTSGTLINLLIGFFVGLSGGATVIIAQYYGAQDHENVHKTVHTAIALGIIGGAALMVIGIILSGPALHWLGTPEDVYPMSLTYMIVYFVGTIPNLIYNIGSGILRAVGDSKRPLYFLIAACLINIVLDLLFVTCFHMGVFGVGLATIISQFVSAFLVLFVLIRSRLSYRLFVKKIRVHKALLNRIIRIGLPAGLQSTMYSLSNVLIQASINSFGTDVMAAWTAFGKLDGLLWMTLNAFNVTVTTFAGQNFGAGKLDRMRKSVRWGMLMACVAAAFIGAVFVIFGRYGLQLFVNDASTLDFGMRIMLVFAPFYITYVPIEILSGACRSAGDSLRPMLMTALGVCGLRLIWLIAVVPNWHELEVLAACYPISWILTSCLFIVYYLRGGWLKRNMPQSQESVSTHP